MKNSRPIDTKKMFYIPLLIIFFTMVIFGYITFTVTAMQFKKSMIENGSTLAETLSHEISDNLEYKKNFTQLLETNLVDLGEYILNHRDLITNEYLHEFVLTATVTDIFWYNPDGLILFDANDEYVGWEPQIGDPIYNFIISDLDLFIEPIRKGTDDDQYYKFVYLRAEDGYFIQLGVNANVLNEITHHYEYQTILEHFTLINPELLYALVVGTDYVSIADTDVEAIGIDYSGDEAYKEALEGITNGSDWYYEEIDETVLEIATPIIYQGEIIGILGIGYSYSNYHTIRTFLIHVFTILILLIILIYTVVQYIRIINPLSRFSLMVESVDLDHITYVHEIKHDNVLSGLNNVFTKLINRVYEKEEENKEIIEKISGLAYKDQLTKLPNRLAIIDILNHLCDHHEKVAVIYLDIDDFKSVNDTKGHYYGDLLIKEIATRLINIKLDQLFISRHQGDEFLILYIFKDETDIDKVLQTIKDQFAEPVEIENSSLYVEFSLGIALSPKDGLSADVLLQKADTAMYEAKKADKMSHMYFNEAMTETLSRKNMILALLNQAIINDGFHMVYQPQVNIDTNEIVAMEALLRINGSTISPGEFILIAEQNRLINRIGRIVIEKVVSQQSKWINENFKIVPIYVNFSANQIQDYTICDYIKEMLLKYEISPEKLGVEITESTVIDNRELTIKTLTDLKELGLKTAIDDFGSGQAGINYMTNFKVDMVKFDKSFSDKYLSSENMEIYRTILKLTHTLGFITLAEGIETKEQIDLLKTTDCKLVQGYFYFKPQVAELIKSFLTIDDTSNN